MREITKEKKVASIRLLGVTVISYLGLLYMSKTYFSFF